MGGIKSLGAKSSELEVPSVVLIPKCKTLTIISVIRLSFRRMPQESEIAKFKWCL